MTLDTSRTVIAGVAAALLLVVLLPPGSGLRSPSLSPDGFTYLEIQYCREGLSVDGEPWWSEHDRVPIRSGRRSIKCGDGSTHPIFVEEGRVTYFDDCSCGP